VEDLDKYLEHPYARIKANAYDLVLNGNEIGGGSIRIFQRELQEKMFAALGLDEHEQKEKFGFLLGAFEYGAPPHGGLAFGFDRLCAILGGSESIRDFIAFPKNNAGRDVMLDAPGEIAAKQYAELHITNVNSAMIYISVEEGEELAEDEIRALQTGLEIKRWFSLYFLGRKMGTGAGEMNQYHFFAKPFLESDVSRLFKLGDNPQLKEILNPFISKKVFSVSVEIIGRGNL
jgi:hypothetical protein